MKVFSTLQFDRDIETKNIIRNTIYNMIIARRKLFWQNQPKTLRQYGGKNVME